MVQFVNLMSPKRGSEQPRVFNLLPIVGITWYSDNGWSIYAVWLHLCLRIGPKAS